MATNTANVDAASAAPDRARYRTRSRSAIRIATGSRELALSMLMASGASRTMPMITAARRADQVQRGTAPVAARPGQPAAGRQAHDADREHEDARQDGTMHRLRRRGAAGQRGRHRHRGHRLKTAWRHDRDTRPVKALR